MQRRHLVASLLASVPVLALTPGSAWSQDYPADKPVKFVVPFAAGGTTDIVARIVAEKMSSTLGQKVVVENRGGAGGLIGAAEVAKAAPDGYTLGVATVSTMAANPAINPKVPYDPLTDFVPILNMAATPNVIAVHPSFAAKDHKSFVETLQANPGKFSYASSGTGSIGHLQMELYKSMSKVFITHIAYRGAGPALEDVAANQVPIIFDNLPSALPYIRDGRLVPIVVAAPHRLAELPNVPTFKDLNLRALNRMAFYGLVAPKGTPKSVVDKVHAAASAALADPAVRKQIEAAGAAVVGNSPSEFSEQIREELFTYKRVVALQKLKID